MKAPIQKGFTLIELMIVVAIIGILAALAIPAYQDNTARAQMTEAFSLISGLKPAVAETIASRGSHKDINNQACGLPESTKIRSKYVDQTYVSSGSITADLRNVNAKTVKSTDKPKIRLNLIADIKNAKYTWVCQSNVEARYMPRDCVYLSF